MSEIRYTGYCVVNSVECHPDVAKGLVRLCANQELGEGRVGRPDEQGRYVVAFTMRRGAFAFQEWFTRQGIEVEVLKHMPEGMSFNEGDPFQFLKDLFRGM